MNSDRKIKEQGRVWLLPHPGLERAPKDGENVCPWPEGDGHGRKFLQVHGSAILPSGKTAHGEMCVWAEYEAPTHARPVKASGRGPRFVQTPLITVGYPAMHTDPWIFHPGFVWSTNKHESAWQWPPQPGDPRQPQAGDLVLFGSPIQSAREQWDWVLDTVVVVRRRVAGANASSLKSSYGKLVEPTLRDPEEPAQPFLGQPHDSAEHHSFAPCKPAAEGNRSCFERPTITSLFRDLRLASTGKRPSPGLGMTLALCRPDAGLGEFWKRLTELVWSQGLALGVDFDLPAIRVLGRDSAATEAAPTEVGARAAAAPTATQSAAAPEAVAPEAVAPEAVAPEAVARRAARGAAPRQAASAGTSGARRKRARAA